MTDIFEKSSLVFAKRRVVQLMLGTTRRGTSMIYADAADATLEALFGVRRLASRIASARDVSEMTYILKKVDYEALFDILRYSESYAYLAKLVILKNDLDNDAFEGKDEKSNLKKVYKKAIDRFVRKYEIRTSYGENNYQDLMRFANGADDDYDFGFDALYDDDDDDFRYSSRRSGRRRTFSDLMELEDDDGYRDFRSEPPYRRRSNVDEFEASMDRSRDDRDPRDRRKDSRDEFDDEDPDAKDDKIDLLTQAVMQMSEAVNKMTEPKESCNCNHSRVFEDPPDGYQDFHQERPINIPKAAPKRQSTSGNVSNDTKTILNAVYGINNKVDGINGKVDKLADETFNLVSEAYDRIDDLAEQIGVVFDDDDDESSQYVEPEPAPKKVGNDTGSFVRSSVYPPKPKPNAVSDQDIADALSQAASADTSDTAPEEPEGNSG